jgi:hypothetical protein
LLVEPEFEPDLCVCEVDVVWVDVGWFDWVDVGWFDWVDVVVGVVPGELDGLEVEFGVEVEELCGGVVLVEDEGVDVPEPLGTEGTVGAETVGVVTVGVGAVGAETVGVDTVGVVRVGVDTFGVVTVTAEAGGRAAMPITTRVVITPTTSFRLRNTVVNLLPQVCSSKSSAPGPQVSHIESLARLRPWGGSRSHAPRPRASPPTASHLET